MATIRALLDSIIERDALMRATLSDPVTKGPGECSKVVVRPIELRGARVYQFTSTHGPKTKDENLTPVEAVSRIIELLPAVFRQGLIQTANADFQVLAGKGDKPRIRELPPSGGAPDIRHNRAKKHLLEEGSPVPFLVELGVMTPEGKVVSKRFDKFRQINRFLEMVDDVAEHLPTDRTIRVVDFGCGKSYLTFALHHYLQSVKGLSLDVVGLDLKDDVIQHCNGVVRKLGMEGVEFRVGDIAHHMEERPVDLVVSLHACDTATDAALAQAVRWGTKVILAVPCCQHEFMKQLDQPALDSMLRHGIIRERFAALATDSARVLLLEAVGYKTQILEFIDMEQTPKNLLIRAVKRDGGGDGGRRYGEYLEFKKFLGFEHSLEGLMGGRLPETST